MSSGLLHAKVSHYGGLIGAIPFLPDVNCAVLFYIGSISGILLSPDLDQQTNSWIENKMVKSKNVFMAMFGHAWMGFWMPYAKCIPHRHPASHLPILGTVLRLLYFCLGLTIVSLFLTILTGGSQMLDLLDFLSNLTHQRTFTCWAYGLFFSDFLHAVWDVAHTRTNWIRRKRK